MKKLSEKAKTESCGPIGLMADKPAEDKVYRWEVENLKARLNYLEKRINVLNAVNNALAKNSGIKVDTFEGVVVISSI